jgi:phosphoribosyl-ATP pyrophosphohydrolase/phosphoribosyl-AMP cyclohydrolase
VENSYTNYLLEEGLDKILKKIAEESGEVIIASKNEDKSELIYEISDLVYHTLVLMVEKNVNIGEIKGELYKRHK